MAQRDNEQDQSVSNSSLTQQFYAGYNRLTTASSRLIQRIQQPYRSSMYGEPNCIVDLEWGQLRIKSMQDLPDDILGWICTFLGVVDITFLGQTSTHLRQITSQCPLSINSLDLLEMINLRLWNPSTKIKIFDFRPREDPPHCTRYLLRYLHLVLQSRILEELAMTWPNSSDEMNVDFMIKPFLSNIIYPKLTKITFMDPVNFQGMYLLNQELELLFQRTPNLKHLCIGHLLGQGTRYLTKLESLTAFKVEGTLSSVQEVNLIDMNDHHHIQRLQCLPNVRRLKSDMRIWTREYVEYLETITTLETIIMETDVIGFPWMNPSAMLSDYTVEDYPKVFGKVRGLRFAGCEARDPGNIWKFVTEVLPQIVAVSTEKDFIRNPMVLEVFIVTWHKGPPSPDTHPSNLEGIRKLFGMDIRLLVKNLHSLCCPVILKVVIDYREGDVSLSYPKPTSEDWNPGQRVRTLIYL